MSDARVTTDGEVRAAAGAGLPAAASKGTWTAGPVKYTLDGRLVVGGRKAVRSASCTFTFAGVGKVGTPPPAVADKSTVTLSPGKTLLSVGGSLVRSGDSQKDGFGNTLTASAAGPVSTG